MWHMYWGLNNSYNACGQFSKHKGFSYRDRQLNATDHYGSEISSVQLEMVYV